MTQYDKLRAAIDDAVSATTSFPARLAYKRLYGVSPETVIEAMVSFTRDMIPRPIEEAPRDGTRFIFFNSTGFWGIGFYINGKHFACDSWSGVNDTIPTHYTPLPEKALEKLLEVVE